MDLFFNILRKFLVGITTLVFAFVVVYVPQNHNHIKTVRTVEAQLAVAGVGPNEITTAISTAASFAKDKILDPIAYQIAKAFISQILRSTIIWINSGFKGSPAFIQDVGQFLRDTADIAAGEYIKSLGEVGSIICKPFRLDIQLALALKYQKGREGKRVDECRLSGIVDNIENFIDGTVSRDKFWEQWIEVTSKPKTYTPYGQMLEAEAALAIRINGKKVNVLQETNWGSGFLSSKVCEPVAVAGGSNPIIIDNEKLQKDIQKSLDDLPPLPDFSAPQEGQVIPDRGALAPSDSTLVQNRLPDARALTQATANTAPAAAPPTGNAPTAGSGAKENCVITTPGQTIAASLNKVLGAGQDSLVAADEINEVIGALVGQIANQALMGAAGLLGLTVRGGGSSRDGNSYVDALLNERQADGNLFNDGISEVADRLAVQTDYRDLAISYIPRLLAVSNDPGASNELRDRADLSYGDAIMVRDTTTTHIAVLQPLVDRYRDLDTEYTTATSERKQAIRQEQSDIISRGIQYRSYTDERLRASEREWSDIVLQ